MRSYDWWQERQPPRRNKSDFWDVNIRFNQGWSQSSKLSSNVKKEGLEVI